MKKVIVGCLLASILLFGSGATVQLLERANREIEQFRKELKIDPREVVFDIKAKIEDGRFTIFGEVSEADLKEKLIERLGKILEVTINDEVKLLPDESVGEKTFAIVKVNVANLMDAPGRTLQKNAVTQARMGDILRLLKKMNGWFLAQMEDSYIGWIDGSAVVTMDDEELKKYLSNPFALIVSRFAQLYRTPDESSMIDEKLVQGSVLPCSSEKEGWLSLKLPDGRELFVRFSDVGIYENRDKVFSERKDAGYIIELAKQHLGLPYLWAGTTSYGFDCSGFTQFCFKMAGYFLRRDADMQFEQGEPVLNRRDLKPADLVFFQTYKPGPSHVGIYIGNMKYIHSGSRGVAINSFDPNDPDYSLDLDKKYIGARRVIPQR